MVWGKRKSNIEKIEDIEILRFFELNKKIKMVKVSNSAIAVDEPSDKKKVEKSICLNYETSITYETLFLRSVVTITSVNAEIQSRGIIQRLL